MSLLTDLSTSHGDLDSMLPLDVYCCSRLYTCMDGKQLAFDNLCESLASPYPCSSWVVNNSVHLAGMTNCIRANRFGEL